MANIKTHLNNIKGALFGKDVRKSIHDGIDAINKELEGTTKRQVDLESTFDELIINAGNSNAEIVDARVKSDGTSYSKLGDRLDAVDLQLEHITNQRKFKPKVYAYMSQGAAGSVNWETYVDEGTYREHLRAMKKAGVDGFAFCLQIQPSKEHRDGFTSGIVKEDELYYRAYPSLENVKLVAQLGEEEGVPLVGFKFHNNWIRDNLNSLSFDKWMAQYENEAYRFAEEFPSDKIKYFPVFNESPTIINDTNRKTRIKTLIDQLRKKGYITGFAGHKGIDYDYDDYMNGIFYHVYPSISNKCENTTYIDAVYGWENSEVKEKLIEFKKQYPNKEIIISESGCQNYWQSLASPEQGVWETGVWDDKGTPSAIFFNGLFEVLGQEDLSFIDSVWLFYTNPILSKTQEIIRKHIKGSY